MLKPVVVYYGTDPEGFFEQDGGIIGSERVLPEKGLGANYGPCVVLDGIQFELHPSACREVRLLGVNLSTAFTNLKQHLASMPTITCCFRGVVDITQAELDRLSEKSRQLLCLPSKNIYGLKSKLVDGRTYLKRSAGGHAHFGLTGTNIFTGPYGDGVDERHQLVPLMDMMVGNTCVLLDRDAGAAERREVYGMAGEYRLPPHGLEYRTLSNFWLRNYSLMSLVFGMGQAAIATKSMTLNGSRVEDDLVESINMDRVIEAIQLNDYDLARLNFLDLMPFLAKNLPPTGFPLNPKNLGKFLEFADAARVKGLETFFPEPPVEHWVGKKFVEFDQFLATL